MTIESVLQELEEMNVEIYAHMSKDRGIGLHHVFLNEELLMMIETSSTEKTISRILYDTKEHATPYQIYLWPINLETDMCLEIDDFHIRDQSEVRSYLPISKALEFVKKMMKT